MTWNRTRLAGWALIIGAVVATGGYLAVGTLVRGPADARYTSPLWTPLNGVAIAGNIIIALGLPVILTCHGRRAARLTLAGYIGVFVALIMLNISESCYEAFIKPYLVSHGGVPSNPPGGFMGFEAVAIIFLLAGSVCLGIAVIRARVFPRWAGVLFLIAPSVTLLPLPGPLAELSDYLFFIALITIGVQIVRSQVQDPVAAPDGAETAPATL